MQFIVCYISQNRVCKKFISTCGRNNSVGTELIFKEYNNTQDGIVILKAEITVKENIFTKGIS